MLHTHCTGQVRDGTYVSVDRDLWTNGGFPTWQRLPEEDDAKKGWTEDSYLIYNIAEDSWYHTNSYKQDEGSAFDATFPHCPAPVGPVPTEGKWAVTIVPEDKAKQPYPSEYSVSIDVSTVHPDFGDSYAEPTGLADLQEFHAQLYEMVKQLGILSHRLTQEQMVKFSANAPTLLPLPTVDERDRTYAATAQKNGMEGSYSGQCTILSVRARVSHPYSLEQVGLALLIAMKRL